MELVNTANFIDLLWFLFPLSFIPQRWGKNEYQNASQLSMYRPLNSSSIENKFIRYFRYSLLFGVPTYDGNIPIPFYILLSETTSGEQVLQIHVILTNWCYLKFNYTTEYSRHSTAHTVQHILYSTYEAKLQCYSNYNCCSLPNIFEGFTAQVNCADQFVCVCVCVCVCSSALMSLPTAFYKQMIFISS